MEGLDLIGLSQGAPKQRPELSKENARQGVTEHNDDPRERSIAAFMEKRGDYNVFHAFYRELVQALYETGASRYVFCVNVDAVIAALLLAIPWKDYRSGVLTEKDLETAAFNVFLYGRMIGAAAEIDDHLNRGRNMDTRTPQERCFFWCKIALNMASSNTASTCSWLACQFVTSAR